MFASVYCEDIRLCQQSITRRKSCGSVKCSVRMTTVSFMPKVHPLQWMRDFWRRFCPVASAHTAPHLLWLMITTMNVTAKKWSKSMTTHRVISRGWNDIQCLPKHRQKDEDQINAVWFANESVHLLASYLGKDAVTDFSVKASTNCKNGCNYTKTMYISMLLAATRKTNKTSKAMLSVILWLQIWSSMCTCYPPWDENVSFHSS